MDCMKKTITVLILPLLFAGKGNAGNPEPLLPEPNAYQVVFQDEFEEAGLDWNVWGSDDAVKTSASGQKVGRWKENAVLADGLLRLMVRKGNRTDSEWTAAYVWVRKLFGPNTYYESRFRVTAATGVNNAFWTAVQTASDESSRAYKNRYEIDVVEAKVLNGGTGITGHLAWHDWKTYSYAGVDIAQGISNTYNTTDFQTWGLWVGEDHFIIYCDGVEQWRGSTHPTYINQWNTGVGKLAVWHNDEEKRAYGKWGQDDWSYLGGMNGDDMNICFSTMPWETSNSLLKDNADGASMDIDYLRIYKKKKDLVAEPVQTIETPVSENAISLAEPLDMGADRNYYFSFLANRPYNSTISCTLRSGGQSKISLAIGEDNELVLSDGTSQVSTAIAYPASSGPRTYFESGKKYLIVGRVTASSTARDIISIRTFETGDSIPEREPFLYRNVDDAGNTSITNEWDINKKVQESSVIDELFLSDDAGACDFSALTFGNTYASVTAAYLNKPLAYLSGQTKSTAERRIFLDCKGKFPFSVVYTDGREVYTVAGIDQSPYTFTVNPDQVSTYTLVSATDGDGNSAVTGGSATFFVNDDDYATLRPVFDTYLTEGTSANPHAASELLVTGKTGAAQESYLVYDIPENLVRTDHASSVFYYTSKSVISPVKIELLGTSSLVDAATVWNTAPAADRWEVLGSMVLGGTSGYYINFDVTPFCNRLLASGERSFTLKLKYGLGDEDALIKFKPGHNTSSSVPSFLSLKKGLNSGIGEHEVTATPRVSFHQESREINIYPAVGCSRILLCDVTGRLIQESAYPSLVVPGHYSGVAIVHFVFSGRTFARKLII